jgi:outer membrane protein
MSKKILLSFLVLSSIIYAETSTFNIKEAFTAGYKNKKMQAALESAKASHEKFVQARSGFLPKVTLNAFHSRNKQTMTRDDNSQTLPKGFNDNYTKQGGATLTQNLFNSGGTLAAVRGAKAQIQKAWFDFEKTEQENFKDIAQVFLSIIAAKKKLEIAHGNIEFLKKQHETAFEKHKVGEETMTNVSASEADLYKGKAEYETAKGTLQSLKEQFEQITLTKAPENFSSPNPLEILPLSYDSLDQKFLENHYALKSIKASIEASQAEADQVSSGLLPKIDFSVSADRNERREKNSAQPQFSPGNQYSTNFAARTDISMPLYEGGEVRSKRREALKNITASRVALENTKAELMTSVTNAWIKVKSLENTHKAILEVVKASKRAVDSASEEQKAGSKTLLDVLEQQQKYFQAQKQLVEIEQDYLKACYDLRASMGTLNAKELKLTVDFMDRTLEEDYSAIRKQF